MRYIGNKDSILEHINNLIIEKNLEKQKTFFDAFSGTASVGNFLKGRFDIIANDYLYFAYVYSNGRLNNVATEFKNLSIDPFDFFNNINQGRHDFITENYSPLGEKGRMYFSGDNAMKIDYIRFHIEDWKKKQLVTDREYYYLIACLLESVSKVANIAGVYGAYLKKWDSRAIKPLKFIRLDSETKPTSISKVYNRKLEEIIESVECDILYLDPPYTKNQYSVQYHILETIAKYDNPDIKGKTGGRAQSFTSNWSTPGKTEILFEKIIATTKAKHIILSYSSAGIMTKDYIESVIKRHCDVDTYELKKIPYKKYRNHQTNDETEHYEYLFYAKKKKKKNVTYTSPLNYMGGKSNMIDFIKLNEPKNYKTFIDLFGGGFNVGVNFDCSNIIYNDCNFKVRQLIEMFKDIDTYDLYKFLQTNIKKYKLDKNNKEAYIRARKDYNHPEPPLRDPRLLYLLVLYGFQQQIRFNSSLDYNNPVGESSFNDKVLEKMISFSRIVKEKNVRFYSDDFTDLDDIIDDKTFVYCDPPYLITLGSYNDGKRGFNGWTETDERRLLDFLDDLNRKGTRFMLSNVIIHKGKTNEILRKWITKNQYNVISYEGKGRKNREEVIIVNY